MRANLEKLRWVLALVALTGCRADEPLSLTRLGFFDLAVVSAYPAVIRDGASVRVCSAGAGEPDHVVVSFGLISAPGQANGARFDADRSLRPGDVIAGVRVGGSQATDIQVDASTVRWRVDCVENLSDDDPACDLAGEPADGTLMAYRPLTANRRQALDRGHNVLVLVDQSASMRGLVHEADLEEGNPNTVIVPPNFSKVASDYTFRRSSAVKEVIASLNLRDRVGVLGFAEHLGDAPLEVGQTWEAVRVPCTLSQAAGVPWDTAMDICFGYRDRRVWTEGIDGLQGVRGDGRSSLWGALSDAYGYLRRIGDRQRANHIVVVTDGPDTCRRESEAYRACESTACASADPRELIAQWAADAADPEAVKVSVHFVQFESPGYPGPDPRQMEAACITGGHYQFINSNQMSRTNVIEFQDALTDALLEVRYSLQGTWEVAIPLPQLKDGLIPRGTLQALSGSVEVTPESGMVKSPQSFDFAINDGPTWDQRLLIRHPCRSVSDCGGAADGPCSESCSTETALCRPDPELPDHAICRDGTGTCCAGECLAGAVACEACEWE